MISSPPSYTMTYLSEILEISHDKLKRFLEEKDYDYLELAKRDKSKTEILLIDDTVLDKRYSKKIEIAKHQWNNCEKKVMEGIGITNAVAITVDGKVELEDYRVYNKDKDEKTKNDHFREMLANTYAKAVMFDSWYASKDNLIMLDELKKLFYAGIKSNRIVFDKDGKKKKIPETKDGELINLKGINFKVRVFHRVSKHGDGVRYFITNDLSISSYEEFIEKYSLRWKIEEFHREIKQLTGIERCQARLGIIQRNHITFCLLAWQALKQKSYALKTTVYQLQERHLSSLFSPVPLFA